MRQRPQGQQVAQSTCQGKEAACSGQPRELLCGRAAVGGEDFGQASALELCKRMAGQSSLTRRTERVWDSILVPVSRRRDPGCTLRAYMRLPVSQFVLIEVRKLAAYCCPEDQRWLVTHVTFMLGPPGRRAAACRRRHLRCGRCAAGFL